MSSIEKGEQERVVANILSQEYSKVSEYPFVFKEIPVDDPPDALFDYRGMMVGAEITEAYQFHHVRSIMDNISFQANKLIRQKGNISDYIGVVINCGALLNVDDSEPILKSWNLHGVKKGVDKAANELAELFIKNFDKQEDFKQVGKLIKIKIEDYPALGSILKSFRILRQGLPDKPEKYPWPRIIPYLGYNYNDEQMEKKLFARVSEKIESKKKNQKKWDKIPHSILVVHNILRDLILFTMPDQWAEWLTKVSKVLPILDTYNELWFVSEFDFSKRIVGNPPVVI